MINHILCSGICLLILHLGRVLVAVNISLETPERSITYRIYKLIVLIKNNTEVAYSSVAVTLHQRNSFHQCIIDIPVLARTGFVYILNGHIICKLVVSKHLAIAVINYSPGTRNGPLLTDLKSKVIQSFLSVKDLKVKYPAD